MGKSTKGDSVEDVTATPTDEEVAGAGAAVEDDAAKVEESQSIDEVSVFDDPSDEEWAAADGAPTGDDEGAAPAVVAPGPDGTTQTPDTTVVDDEVKIDPPSQDAEGKWVFGKYKADDLQTLLVEVEKGRVNAEKALGRKGSGDQSEPANPFTGEAPAAGSDDEGFDAIDELPIYDPDAYAQTIASGVTQALMQSGLIQQQPQQQGPDLAAAQVVSIANQAIQSQATTGDEFRAVVGALLEHAPHDVQTRNNVLRAWHELDPIEAIQVASTISTTMAQMQHQQQVEQQQAAALQQYQEQVQQQEQSVALEQAGVSEFTAAQQAFVQQNPGWERLNTGMEQWLQHNRVLMDAANAQPVTDPRNPNARPRAAAVFQVLTAARDYALQLERLGQMPGVQQQVAAPVAGFQGGVSEHGGTMQGVAPQSFDPAAIAAAQFASTREMGSLENGVTDDVVVRSMQGTPQALAQMSSNELFAIPTA